MAAKTFLITALIAPVVCASAPQPAAHESLPGYTLAWHDEFDHDGTPDPAKWGFERGFLRNRELQWFQPENAHVADGTLIIDARREDKPNPLYNSPAQAKPFRNRPRIRFTSASVTTKGLFSFRYGRLDIRARFPAQDGLWPALWMVGEQGSWPSNGETDLFEYYHRQIHANFAWAGAALHRPMWQSVKIPVQAWTKDPEWASRFHVWTMIWDPRRITLELDGRVENTLDVDNVQNVAGAAVRNPFRQPAHIIMGLALGGMNGGSVAKTRFPARLEIDYVRVYRRDDAAAATPATNNPPPSSLSGDTNND